MGGHMEQLLALAILLVAFATLVFANVFNRWLRDYDQRFRRSEHDVNELRSGQQDSAREIAKAEDRAVEKSAQRLRRAEAELARYRADWRSLASKHKDAAKETAAVSRRVDDLSKSVKSTFENHESRLDALDRLTAALSAREDDAAEVAELRAEMGRQLTALRQLRGEFTGAADQTAQALADIREQLLALAGKVELLDYDRQDLRSQLRRWLNYSARRAGAGQAAQIMPGFVAAQEQAASEILPILYEALLRATGFDPLFREHRGEAGTFYYLAWSQPNGQPPRRRLEDLLAASADDGVSADGVTEFRSLLLALYTGGTGTVRLGPLVVSHTGQDAFLGAVMTAGEVAELDEDDSGASPVRSMARLTEFNEDRVVNLADWAADQLS
jgi:hypothetical protein